MTNTKKPWTNDGRDAGSLCAAKLTIGACRTIERIRCIRMMQPQRDDNYLVMILASESV